jgi:DNA transformation protein
MPVSHEFEQFIVEQLSRAGLVMSRRMFGGVGIYLEGEFIAILGGESGRLFLRVDDSNRDKFVNAGMEAFRPYRKKPETTMSYYQVPAEVLEDQTTLFAWALESLEIARRSPSQKDRRKASRKRSRV